MGKRSSFERVEKDFYPTPYEAVVPLLEHLKAGTKFDEPCCGDGRLINHLEKNGHFCLSASDIDPKITLATTKSFSDITECHGDVFITNPPWSRDILHPLIEHLSDIAPTWLLFDADWMHTRQSAELMKRCHKIISVGRVKWIPESKMTGKDNCAWYLFDGSKSTPTVFYGRN